MKTILLTLLSLALVTGLSAQDDGRGATPDQHAIYSQADTWPQFLEQIAEVDASKAPTERVADAVRYLQSLPNLKTLSQEEFRVHQAKFAHKEVTSAESRFWDDMRYGKEYDTLTKEDK